ncbi:MAG: 16S rRNA (guanine(966)-N(2))-methyltransferase RsmD, partial [Phycisphaerales bacterium]|nr:16S rRNA (guanine(966)-N(2))-methyltransferase RsmD [Phycisphaerales bacterium]
MRIIGGEFRGRPILPPEGSATRPITDRAKQSLFDILAPRIEGSLVYDCFCGTGSLGLEALSRGARFCTFFEADRSALARLSQNITKLQVAARSRIVPGDLFKWFHLANTRPDAVDATGADLVFLDPPYQFLQTQADEILQLALHLTSRHLRPEGLVIFRHDSRDRLPLPNLIAVDFRTFGDMEIEFLRLCRDSG